LRCVEGDVLGLVNNNGSHAPVAYTVYGAGTIAILLNDVTNLYRDPSGQMVGYATWIVGTRESVELELRRDLELGYENIERTRALLGLPKKSRQRKL
jgi:hypothetical protein